MKFPSLAPADRLRAGAFTLLEMMVVIGVLAIISLIAVPTYATVKDNAVKRTLLTTATSLIADADAAADSAAALGGPEGTSLADIHAALGEARLWDAVGGNDTDLDPTDPYSWSVVNQILTFSMGSRCFQVELGIDTNGDGSADDLLAADGILDRAVTTMPVRCGDPPPPTTTPPTTSPPATTTPPSNDPLIVLSYDVQNLYSATCSDQWTFYTDYAWTATNRTPQDCTMLGLNWTTYETPRYVIELGFWGNDVNVTITPSTGTAQTLVAPGTVTFERTTTGPISFTVTGTATRFGAFTDDYPVPDLQLLGIESLVSVDSWRTTGGLTSMEGSFYLAENLTSVPAVLPSGVTDLGGMFLGASVFNSDISAWNTTGVADMSHLFRGAANFNQDISSWDTSAVTDMYRMFLGATSFNQDISAWDTAAVTDMSDLFYGATVFNQPIGSWDTGSVTWMNGMFYNATAFNQPIGSWNIANVSSMYRMFFGATAFNQGIGAWNTALVEEMGEMFFGASAFDQDLSSWCVSLLPAEPSGFDTGATTWTTSGRQPLWGTCP